MKYLLPLFFLLFGLIAAPVYAATIPVPSAHCLSSSPCTTNGPSSTVLSPTSGGSGTTSGQPSSAPSSTVSNPSSAPSTNPSPSSTPCSTSGASVASQSTGTVSAMSRHHHGKWHSSGNQGFLQQLIQWLWQFLQQLFQKLGIQLPGLPCGTSSSPSGTPSSAPSSGAGGGSGGSSPSGTPSSAPGNTTPTIFGTSPAPTGSGSTTTSGFITASGTKLMLNGKQYRSIGFDISPLGDCWNSNWSTSQMDAAFSAMPSGSLVRFFAPDDSGDSASFVESIVKEADKYNVHLIIALADADGDNNCDTDDENGSSGKTAAYYTDAVQSGSNWENWVKSVVPPLASDPGVGIWEISNEPFHEGATISSVGMTTAENYVNTAAAYIRSFDKNHLISIAPADVADLGGTSGMETLFKNLDVVDDHDYSADADSGSPPVNTEFPTVRQIAQDLNKPFMIDEAGVEAGTSCSSSTVYNAWDNGSQGLSLQGRVTFLVTDKATDYLSTSSSGGASAIDFWLYTGQSGGCSYENINTSDPIMAAVKSFVMPN